MGKKAPPVYKLIDGNESEVERVKTSPELEYHMRDVREGRIFEILNGADSISIKAVETPGHLSDHLCFKLEEEFKGEGFSSIFTGDHIIGASSTYFTDYPKYFESLLKVKDLVESDKIETLYPAHSTSLYMKDICLPALPKVNDYIERRSQKDRKIEELADEI